MTRQSNGGETVKQMTNCHDCGATPGTVHGDNCDVERCSVCGGQRIQCYWDCKAHDPAFARWSGWWPGGLESEALGLDLNEFHEQGFAAMLFVAPTQ